MDAYVHKSDKHTCDPVVTPSIDIGDQLKTTRRKNGIRTKTQHPVTLEAEKATEAREEETPPMPAQEAEKMQGKNVHTDITSSVWPRQELSVGSDKEDVIMDEIDAARHN